LLKMELTRERRRLLFAILASLLLHFAVAVSLASFGDKLALAPPEEEKPAELTIVDLAPTPPSAPKNSMFVDTPQNKQTTEAPKEKTFESNANSMAASELPTLGQAPVPTQEGRERPSMDLENQQHSLAQSGAQPQPSVPPVANPTPRPTPSAKSEPSVTPDPEALAMLRATPPPAITPPEESQPSAAPETVATPRPTPPQAPSSAYRREQQRTRMAGNISNRGVSSLNAVGTPLGRYQKLVYDAIGSRWYALVDRNRDRINIGTVHIDFFVDRSGQIKDIKMQRDTMSESFTNLCLESVQEVKVPPIPEDVAATLPAEGLAGEVNFTIYPN
jgi:hypothetical protein